jgi:hypothetical protein
LYAFLSCPLVLATPILSSIWQLSNICWGTQNMKFLIVQLSPAL